ncbi:MAG: 3-isopropylmalate dehydratase small subunit [Candidatus Calescibacterium sp.]|nr:3-isopropylmalate dehydratase small subunit [Candidatus Calescibacterium sp.]MCX7758134.1 3-isopropylmalate dehydratase small subunit [bacterium]
MKGITIYKGKATYIDRADIDTDQIMPKQFLKRIEKTGFGQYVFYEWRYLKDGSPNMEFELNKYPNSTILITGPNFGCGSSREHAVWGLKEYGFRVVISPSFADIFYFNAVENMLLPCTVTHDNVKLLIQKVKEKGEYYLTVDLPNQLIYDDENIKISFIIDQESKDRLIKGWDSIDLVLRFEDKISEYEKNRPSFFPTTQNFQYTK